MKQVMAYLASDGKLFRESERCLDYERAKEFKHAYNNMALASRLRQCTLGNASSVSSDELANWILENKEIVLSLIEGTVYV